MSLSRRHVLGAGLILGSLPRTVFAARPHTPAEWLAEWLTAFNDPGSAVYPDFVRRNIPNLVPYLDEDLGCERHPAALFF